MNLELLELGLKATEEAAKDGKHAQGSWRCRTGMCFAGWTATVAGREWAFPMRRRPCETDDWLIATPEEVADRTLPREAFWRGAVPGQVLIHVQFAVKRMLGLSTGRANDLFCGDNTLERIKQQVEYYRTMDQLFDGVDINQLEMSCT